MIKYFQKKSNNWSKRNRGIVERNVLKIKNKKNTLTAKNKLHIFVIQKLLDFKKTILDKLAIRKDSAKTGLSKKHWVVL